MTSLKQLQKKYEAAQNAFAKQHQQDFIALIQTGAIKFFKRHKKASTIVIGNGTTLTMDDQRNPILTRSPVTYRRTSPGKDGYERSYTQDTFMAFLEDMQYNDFMGLFKIPSKIQKIDDNNVSIIY